MRNDVKIGENGPYDRKEALIGDDFSVVPKLFGIELGNMRFLLGAMPQIISGVAGRQPLPIPQVAT